MHIRQTHNDGSFVDLSELVGQTVNRGEALLGMHLPRDIPRTLAIFDEASGIDDTVHESCKTWAHRILIIGNPFPCENFFKQAVKEGNLKALSGDNLQQRKVIHVRAEDSTNIKNAILQMKAGTRKPEPCLIRSDKNPRGPLTQGSYLSLRKAWIKSKQVNPSQPMRIPGLISIDQYVERKTRWGPVLRCISLDGEFYEGSEVLMYPDAHLNASHQYYESLGGNVGQAKTMGIDPAEGGDSTVFCICSRLGIVDIISEKTPDTSKIILQTKQLINKYKLKSENVYFDRGGGGKQHADYLRAEGFRVKTVGFGEAATAEVKRGLKPLEQRKLDDEVRQVYKNRRAEMYGILMDKLDPSVGDMFAISDKHSELIRQLRPIPRQLDGEGKLYLPPKRKTNPNSTEITMKDLVGCSPDEADALVLATFGLFKPKARRSIQILS